MFSPFFQKLGYHPKTQICFYLLFYIITLRSLINLKDACTLGWNENGLNFFFRFKFGYSKEKLHFRFKKNCKKFGYNSAISSGAAKSLKF